MKRRIAAIALAVLMPVGALAQSPGPSLSGTTGSVTEQGVCVQFEGPPLTGQRDLLERLEAGTVTLHLGSCAAPGPTPSPFATPTPSPTAPPDPLGDSWSTIRRTYPRAEAASLQPPTEPDSPRPPPLYLQGRVTGQGTFLDEGFYVVALDPDIAGMALDVRVYHPNRVGSARNPTVEVGDVIEAVVEPKAVPFLNILPADATRVHVIQHTSPSITHDSWSTIRRTYAHAYPSTLSQPASLPLYLHGRLTGEGTFKGDHYVIVAAEDASGEPYSVWLYDQFNFGPHGPPHRPIPSLRRGDVIDAVVKADFAEQDGRPSAIPYRVRILGRER